VPVSCTRTQGAWPAGLSADLAKRAQRYGIRCRGDRVVAIQLSDNNLQGVIPSTLASAFPE
jgi:hypothetical protein